jgi:hypothetical protein
MVITEGTYDDFKRCAFMALDYQRVLNLVKKLTDYANHFKPLYGVEFFFRGEQVLRSLVVLWYDYQSDTPVSVVHVNALCQRVATYTQTEVVTLQTEMAHVIDARGEIPVSMLEMMRMSATRAGQVGFLTECPADYATLFPFKVFGPRIEPERASLVLSLLEAQKAQAQKSGGNEHANFAWESVVNVLQMKGPATGTVEMEPDTTDVYVRQPLTEDERSRLKRVLGPKAQR